MSVNQKSGNILRDLKPLMIETAEDEDSSENSKNILKFNGPTIIYCPTKNATGDVITVLKSLGIKCDLYHAGLSLDYRKKSQTNFINDNIDVMVATVAFGMGIDKPGWF